MGEQVDLERETQKLFDYALEQSDRTVECCGERKLGIAHCSDGFAVACESCGALYCTLDFATIIKMAASMRGNQ